jgi:transcriptional regulator with XRE-family HTH domain
MDFFGGWLKQKRKEKNISGRELAKMIEKSPSYVGQLEIGHIKLPSVDVGRKIMDALEIEDPEETLTRFGVIERKDRIRYVLNMDEEIERDKTIKAITRDLEHMERDQLEALYISMNKYRDILMHISFLEGVNQNSNKNNPVNALREYAEFLTTKYNK